MEYLTVSEYSKRMRIGPQAVRRACEAGTLRAVKVGSQWRIPDPGAPGGDGVAARDPADEARTVLLAVRSMLEAVKATLDRLEAAI